MKKYLLLATTAFTRFAAFEGDNVPKLDGVAPVREGKLVFKLADGKEELVDPSELFTSRSRITALNNEAMGHRTAKDAATAKLKDFDGIDPVKAREAFETLSKIDQKKLIDAGKLDEVRAEIGKSFQGQLAERDTKLATLIGQLQQRILGDAFRDSPFLKDKLAIPVDIAQATFKDLFTVAEDGGITAKDRQGNPVYSRDPAKSGQPAGFEEAIQIIVDGYVNKASILKGNNNSGSGNGGNGGNKPGNGNTMTRAAYEALPSNERGALASKLAKRELTLVD